MSILRPYQQEAKTAVLQGLIKGIINQLLVLATGTGKTKLAVDIIKPMGRVLWITHSIELIEQSSIALLAEELGILKEVLEFEINRGGGLINILQQQTFNSDITNNIGIIKEDLMITDKRITVASIQTLWRRLDQLPPDMFDVIVVDEAHYSGAKTWAKTLNHFTPKLRLGLTATPHRQDGMLLGDLFDEIIYEYNIDRGIAEGYLCELDAIRVKTNIDLDKIRTVAGDLNQGELEVVINTPERNALIVEKYLQYASGRQFIAFCVDVKHAQDLCQAFKDRDVNCEFIVGNKELTTDRKGLINSFKDGEITGLTNCMVLTAGFDHPNVGCIIQACPTKSLTKYMQQVGRGTRLKDELFISRFKQNCIILDFIDNTTKHRLVNTWTLDREKPSEQRTFLTSEKRQLLIADRERRHKIAQLEKDQKVNLLKLPKPKIITSMRMQEPATEAQLKWIERDGGYDIVNNVYTKQMCSEIIATFPATEKQVWLLAKKGYDVSQGVTKSEAIAAFKEIEEREARENTERLKKENKFPFTDLK